MSEYETSFPPSNPVIATVVCTEEGAVRAGDVVGLTEEEVKLSRPKRPREEELMNVTLEIQQEFQQVAGVVWADTSVDVGTKIAVAVAGAITIRSEGHEGVRPGDYIVASPNKKFKPFDSNAVYELSSDQLLKSALKKLDKNEIFIDWIQMPFHDPALNSRYNRALQKLFGVEGDLVPPNRITRLFGYNGDKWQYVGKMGQTRQVEDQVVFQDVNDDLEDHQSTITIKNFTLGPIIDEQLGLPTRREGQPVWGSEENGIKLTEAFVEGGLETDKIPMRKNNKKGKRIDEGRFLSILKKVAKAKIWALMPTDDLKVLDSDQGFEDRITKIDVDSLRTTKLGKELGEFFRGLEMDEPVQFSARPFAKCLEVGEGVLRVLLIHNSP